MGGRAEVVDIRPLVPDDLPAVGRLFTDHTGRPVDLELIAGWVDEAPAAVAVGAGDVVGFAFCRRFAPDVAEVANLLVTPPHRRRGLGTALLAAVEEAAVVAGYRAMIVVQSSLYRAGGPSAGGPAVPATEVTHTGTYGRRGYREVLSTGPTAVSVKALVDG